MNSPLPPLEDGAITLRQLQQRLTSIVAMNDETYPNENRNDLPVVVEKVRRGKNRNLKSRYYAIHHANGVATSFGDKTGWFVGLTAYLEIER